MSNLGEQIVKISTDTEQVLRMGLLHCAHDMLMLMKQELNYIHFFDKRKAFTIVPFVKQSKRIKASLSSDWDKMHVLCQRYRQCFDKVSVTVKLPKFCWPCPGQVHLPPEMKPLSAEEIHRAFKKYQRLVDKVDQPLSLETLTHFSLSL